MAAELMTEAESKELTDLHGATYAAWEFYARWLKRFRAERPDDERDDLELTGVFHDEMMAKTLAN